MSQTYQIQYFLGANSPQGFYSLYDQLLPPETANAIYILKGGPGCGKSTLMRQVAAQAAQAGETAEYILCSGDPDSLDGVVLPRLKAALVDGTAPHVIEPKYPGVVEQYVNLGVCYDREGLQAVREELQGCMRGYKEHYQRAYRCLGAAAEIREDVRDTLMTEELEAKLAKRARGILSRELKPRKTGEAGAVKQRVFIPLKSLHRCKGALPKKPPLPALGRLTNQRPQKTQAIFSAGETKNAGKPFWPNEYFCEICRNKAPLFSRCDFVNSPTRPQSEET